jgi:poly-gamma-glutamate capsule biosynthesis protein CapA/YwtB (metallophosphatase superfamily)
MKVALLGDIGLFGKFSIANSNVFDYFKDVAEALKSFDLIIGNLETPLCKASKPYGYKSAYINADPKNVELLKYLNISIVNLANNHIFDYGTTGYKANIGVLQANNIDYFGIENKTHYLDFGNNHIALSGFCCYSTNACGYYDAKSNIGVNILNAYEVEATLLKNHNNGYLNIASFHCGQEHIHYPNYDHIEIARKLASKVPYIFYGHHPHVMQGIEQIETSLIAYSLGNFCFDDVYTNKSNKPLVVQTSDNRKSFILSLEIENSKLNNFDIIPIYCDDLKMTVGQNNDICDELAEYSKLLTIEKNEYKKQRNKLLQTYLNTRKSARDLEWYVKRLNLNSIRMITNSRRNLHKYEYSIRDYINNVVK